MDRCWTCGAIDNNHQEWCAEVKEAVIIRNMQLDSKVVNALDRGREKQKAARIPRQPMPAKREGKRLKPTFESVIAQLRSYGWTDEELKERGWV